MNNTIYGWFSEKQKEKIGVMRYTKSKGVVEVTCITTSRKKPKHYDDFVSVGVVKKFVN